MVATSERAWQVLIVEDDHRTRDFFVGCVSARPELALAGTAGSVAEALKLLSDQKRRIDVLMVDLGLPDGSGIEVIRAATRTHPECDPLVVSMFGDEENVLKSVEAGAVGYIHKDAAPEDIPRAILDMKAGASPISPMIARRLLERFRKDGTGPGRKDERAGVQASTREPEKVALSSREREVLNLIARGFSYAEVGRLTSLTVDTVRSHIRNLYAKLAVHSRSEAVYEATKMGLL